MGSILRTLDEHIHTIYTSMQPNTLYIITTLQGDARYFDKMDNTLKSENREKHVQIVEKCKRGISFFGIKDDSKS